MELPSKLNRSVAVGWVIFATGSQLPLDNLRTAWLETPEPHEAYSSQLHDCRRIPLLSPCLCPMDELNRLRISSISPSSG